MGANHPVVRHDDQPVGVGPHRGRPAHDRGVHAVAIAVEQDQRGGGDPGHFLPVSVKRHPHGKKVLTFFGEDLGDCAIRELGMLLSGGRAFGTGRSGTGSAL